MKTLKSLFAVLLCLAMVLGMVACNQNAAPVEQPPAEPQVPAEPEAPEAEKIAPGTYEGEAIANGGTLKMAMTIDENGEIAQIEVLSHSETEGIFNTPFERIPAAIIAGQTLAVDTVSGATLTSFGLINAAANCLENAGADVSAYRQKADGGEKPAGEPVEKTADIVIIGGGGTGLVAAISALENGAGSVIVLEKTAYLGGNTLVCGGIYNTPDEEGQSQLEMGDGMRGQIETALAEAPVDEAHAALLKELQAEYDAYNKSGAKGVFDSPAWFALQTWNGGDKVADLSLVRTMADNAYEGYTWLRALGLEFEDKVTQGAGSLYPRTHGATTPSGTGYIAVYKETLASYPNCEIMMETEGKELLTDANGRVIGVKGFDKAKNADVTLTAEKGVIIATGGFAGNVELRQKYCEGEKWSNLGTGVLTTNLPGVTGDGIFMAEAVGANLVDMEQIQLLHLGNPRTGATTGATTKCRTADEVIFVNKNGERFVAEDDRRDIISGGILKQPDQIMYIIHDSNNLPNSEEQIVEYIKMGYLYRADSLAELAGQLDMPADALQASLDAYNAAVDAGSGDPTGRTLLHTKIDTTGVLFAVPRVASAHHTMGGVQIDTSGHVLNAQGAPIAGLYAGGEVVGGIHGGNRLGGNAVVDTIVFGKIAGETAAKGE